MNMDRRLFFALWPDDEVRTRVDRLAAAWDGHAGRRIPRENYHITLAFLGMVNAERQACLERAAAGLAGRPFVLHLDRAGYFPRSQVLWLGAAFCPEALTVLAHDLAATVMTCGNQRADGEGFTPHLTLLRDSAPPPPDRLRVAEPVVWRVGSFCLVESILMPRGSEYRVLAEYPLAPALTPSPA
ncbi:MAG: RNA 2',3'-cyclic phosphodiesterase [Ectothiorhodospiraceae bacterium]|jgi:2'-5' RNA ligase|nr:RNA 2',3'-cyclic phosphodiesterase [Ectothiorhodospiraceae bacterium]